MIILLEPNILILILISNTFHASLLPRWRGAGPIQWSLLSGDTSTGVSFMEIGSYSDAIQILNEVITLSPQYYKAYET